MKRPVNNPDRIAASTCPRVAPRADAALLLPSAGAEFGTERRSGNAVSQSLLFINLRDLP
jgi:hypothetical protein